jgi:hypothetical protein
MEIKYIILLMVQSSDFQLLYQGERKKVLWRKLVIDFSCFYGLFRFADFSFSHLFGARYKTSFLITSQGEV